MCPAGCNRRVIRSPPPGSQIFGRYATTCAGKPAIVRSKERASGWLTSSGSARRAACTSSRRPRRRPAMDPSPAVVGPPPLRLLPLEQRAVAELGAMLAASPFLRAYGRGDRHPVFVIPGFTAGDRSTQPLRWSLRQQGYWVHGWRLGANWGPRGGVMEAVDDRLLALHGRHGVKVSIIGWSLGGIYARHLARRHPEAVRQVITLGSPF